MLDSTAVVVLAALAAASWLALRRPSTTPAPPTFGPWYLPNFARGLLAVYELGKDDTAFVLGLRRLGPVVYIPWPLAQYFVTTNEAIQKVYREPEAALSFFPIRRRISHTVFSMSFWQDRVFLDETLFPVHAKAMTRASLTPSLARFTTSMRESIDTLAAKVDASPDGEAIVDLSTWVLDVLWEAGLCGIFGGQCTDASGIAKKDLFRNFVAFDGSFPIEASGIVPSWLLKRIPEVQAGRKSRDVLVDVIEAWIKDGVPGVADGPCTALVDLTLEYGANTRDAALILTSLFWALQANAPFVAMQLITYILQSPLSVRQALQAEADASFSDAAAADDLDPLTFSHLSRTMPLLQSCITETLRLGTLSFSIRLVSQPFVVPGGDGSPDYVLPVGSTLISPPRIVHLDERRYGETVMAWDGERFYDGPPGSDAEKVGEKSKMARETYGFGGGVSKCEGQHFATAELKSFISLVLSKFDIEAVAPSPEMLDKYDRIPLVGVDEPGYKPKPLPGRTGVGTFQYPQDVPMRMRVRRRKI
ncbi:hypothetical protein JCM8097_006977 [Rhodosporidiobolus ruineniae]